MARTFKDIMKKSGLAPHRQLGQNFLTNPRIAERIVEAAAITDRDTVVEIGVGFGSLTIPLARVAARVIGMEIDAGIIRYHQEQHSLPDNVLLLHQDILQADFDELYHQAGGPLKIVANLPYSISSPLLFRLIDHHHLVDSAHLMLQKEVADRLTAGPGTREYGILSVLLGNVADVRQVLRVGPGNFHPRPRVDSVVVGIRFRPPDRQNQVCVDKNLLRRIVKTAFNQRRKTIANSLASLFTDRDRLLRLLSESGIDPASRADRLSLEDYRNLTARAEAEHGKQ